MDSPAAGQESAFDYIDTLNECDTKIVGLLRIHADAVKCLTAEGGNSKLTADQRRLLFQHKISEFMKVLGEVRDTQHKAIYALKDTASGETGRTGEGLVNPKAILGELGDLDVSFLNSQNDDVGKQIEAEQWKKAVEIIRKFEQARKDNNESQT